jgi:hypothetical protein
MPVARERAEKRVPTLDPATKQRLTEAEWRAKVEDVATDIFAAMSPIQVSPAFDAPQFCDEWISVARPTGQYEGYVVKCRGVARDKNGNPKISKIKGTELIAWVIYEPRKAA